MPSLQIVRGRFRLPGKSALAGAIHYSLTRLDARTPPLRDGRACLENSSAERAIRPVAPGRTNYLFAGSHCRGERAAAIYSLIIPAELNDRDPEACLRAVLTRIADYPVNQAAACYVGKTRQHQADQRQATQPAVAGRRLR